MSYAILRTAKLKTMGEIGGSLAHNYRTRETPKQYLGGRAKLSAMQTDFAEQVGRKHGLERGLEGSRASHTSIREYYGRVGQAQEKTPSVDVPEPSIGERMNVKAYGDRVAKAVLEQLGPELRQLRAKAAEADAAKREAKQARAALEI